MNAIYHYLHKALAYHVRNTNSRIKRHEAIVVIGRYMKFIPKHVQKAMVDDMVKLKMLKKRSRDELQVTIPKDISFGFMLDDFEIEEKYERAMSKDWWT